VIESFECKTHPFLKREVCGAVARGELNRTEFGMTREAEHDPIVRLTIDIEVLEGDSIPPPPPLPPENQPSASPPERRLHRAPDGTYREYRCRRAGARLKASGVEMAVNTALHARSRGRCSVLLLLPITMAVMGSLSDSDTAAHAGGYSTVRGSNS
jgi:hypothetical protein